MGRNAKGMRELQNIRRQKERHEQRVRLETGRTTEEEENAFPSEPRNLNKFDPKHQTNNKSKRRRADLKESKTNEETKNRVGPRKRKVG